MTYADDRALREELYKAYVTRASDQSEQTEFDNSKIMEEILSLRQEMAKLLGFNNYAEYSLASKMAPDVKTVHDFLVDLAEHARTPALQEVAEPKLLPNKMVLMSLNLGIPLTILKSLNNNNSTYHKKL